MCYHDKALYTNPRLSYLTLYIMAVLQTAIASKIPTYVKELRPRAYSVDIRRKSTRIACYDKVSVYLVIMLISDFYYLSSQPPRSTQPCIPLGSLNRVPDSAGVKAEMSPLPGGR